MHHIINDGTMADTYWERIKGSFDERKLMDLVFNKVHMDHNPSGMSHRWGIIQQACYKWHGIQQEAMNRQESGTSIRGGARLRSTVVHFNIQHLFLL
jgi:hypothetical protein